MCTGQDKKQNKTTILSKKIIFMPWKRVVFFCQFFSLLNIIFFRILQYFFVFGAANDRNNTLQLYLVDWTLWFV